MKETLGRLGQAGQLLVGIGPMSRICVDTVYNYSNENLQPLMLIASRRQIECAALGRGYVNNWTTEEFGKYCAGMREKYPKSTVFLCRDHGGPWQGNGEEHLGLNEAMERAVKSYEADIDAGFDLLHIDPSLCKDDNFSTKAVIENTIKLLRACNRMAKERGRSIQYEIGTEENMGTITTVESFSQIVASISAVCSKEGFNHPLFVVGQTQSLVKEMRQIGEFNLKNTKQLMDVASRHGFMLKEHNADYLDEYQLRQRLSAEVPAINVAPEFGVLESRAFVNFCLKNNHPEKADAFLQLAHSSGKWRKWVLNPDHVSEYDKAIICGHYVFSKPEFAKICEGLDMEALEKEIMAVLESRLDFYFKRYR